MNKPSGSYVSWDNTMCNALAPAREQARSAWEDGYESGKAAALEKVKTLTNEQIEKVIKDNMMFSMNLAGMRVDLVELIES